MELFLSTYCKDNEVVRVVTSYEELSSKRRKVSRFAMNKRKWFHVFADIRAPLVILRIYELGLHEATGAVCGVT